MVDSVTDKLDKVMEVVTNVRLTVEKLAGDTSTAHARLTGRMDVMSGTIQNMAEAQETHNTNDKIIHESFKKTNDGLDQRVEALESKGSYNAGKSAGISIAVATPIAILVAAIGAWIKSHFGG